MPQLNATEQDLMALLQQERERNSSVQAPPPIAPNLPELAPEMFLSPAAQREVEAMRGIPNISTPLVSETIRANRQTLSITPEEVSFSASFEEDLTDADLSPPARGAATVEPNLANLFMAQALRETGTSPAEQRRAERLGTELDFSFAGMDGDIEIDYSNRRPSSGGSGGVVVAQRGPTGFVPISRQEAVARDTAARPAQRSQPSPSPAPLAPVLSRYERLLGPSIID